MGIFHWRRIPKSLVMLLPEFQHLHLHSFQGVVKRLLHLSLINASNEGQDLVEYDIHPLLHERIFQCLPALDAQRYCLSIINVVASIFPVITWEDKGAITEDARSIGQYLLPHALRLIELIEDLALSSKNCAVLLQSRQLFG